MARVTKDEVRAIIVTNSTTIDDTALDSFINTANTFVTATLGSSTSLTSGQLKDIELYVAAHFVGIKDKRITSEKTGDASAKYEGKTEMGLKFTRYGQMAIMLDTSGTLAKVSSGKVANF